MKDAIIAWLQAAALLLTAQGVGLGHQVFVENRAGLSGLVEAHFAAREDRGRWTKFRAPWRVDATREQAVRME